MTKKDITYQDKLNELKLDLSHPNNRGIVFVLLEGETDIRLFRKLFNLMNCRVERIPGGNKKVEQCVEELLDKHQLVIGIRDADFINLSDINYSKEHMFLTDFHDIEMTIISDEVSISDILCDYTTFPIEKHKNISENIIKSIEQVSLMKWLNERENLEISFEKTGYLDLISFDNASVDFDQYFNRLLSRSPNAKIKDVLVIIDKFQNLLLENPSPLQLCNGHDYIAALSQFLRTHGNTSNISSDLLEGILRIKYAKESFSKTDLHNSIHAWSESKKCLKFCC